MRDSKLSPIATPLLTLLVSLGLSAPLHAAPALSKTWSVEVSEEAGVRRMATAPGRVVAVTWGGDLVALDAATGKQAWRKKARGSEIDEVSIGVEGDVVAVAWPKDAALHGYAVADGAERWSRALPSAPTGMAICAGDRVVVATHRGAETLMATAVDPTDGTVRWTVPADGPVVGAGGRWVFTTRPSGFGVWPGAIEAIECATGIRSPLVGGPQKLVEWLAAGDDAVVTRQLDPGFANEVLCVHRLPEQAGAPAKKTCAMATDGEVETYSPTGALVRDGVLYFSTAHIEAHNLNPAPDSWLFARTLGAGALWRSEAMVASGAPVDAGAQLLTGFGSTGADDYVYAVDPATGKVLGSMKLRKAPTVMAADATQGYVASYDGRVAAFALPGKGLAPVARQSVPVGPSAKAFGAAAEAGPVSWSVVTTISAHPPKAKTSGQRMVGQASAVAFVDAAGKEVVVGGNDDKVRVYEVATKRRLWISKGLGKDVEHVAVGGDRIHARIYGGVSYTFAPKSRGWRRLARLDLGHGWMTGLSDDGFRLVADDFSGRYRAFDPVEDKALWTLTAKGEFDRRGTRLRGNRLVVSKPGALEVLDVRGDEAKVVASVPTPTAVEGGKLSQAWMVNDALLLREYCGPAECLIELVPVGDGAASGTASAEVKRVAFDVRGAGWATSVPSALDVSRDGRSLFFFRLGLLPVVVDLADMSRTPVGEITGKAPSEYTEGVFSLDGRRLVLGMHPKPWQITVIERK